MNIKFDTVWLADDTFRAFGITFNGRAIVEDGDFLRAAYSTPFARKNRKSTFSFSVNRPFGSILEAENYLLGHHSTLVDSGTLLARIGLISDGQQDLTWDDAALEDVQTTYQGVNVVVRYTFRVGAIAGVILTPTEDVFTNGTTAIGNGVSSVTVSGLGLASIPDQVLVTVRKPANGFNLVAAVDDSTITTDGFTAYFNGNTDSANYKLDWLLLF